MNKLWRKSIQFKIAAWSGICLMLVGAVTFGYAGITQRDSALSGGKDHAQAEAMAFSGQVHAEMEVAIGAARTLAEAFSAFKANKVFISREQVNVILKQILVENPGFLGVYTAWELDAFDGKDSMLHNATGHDATGRFIPHWVNTGGTAVMSPLANYEVQGPGDWYLLPRDTLQDAVTEPYTITVDGGSVLVASLSSPVVVDGKFLGVTGIDLRLDFLQELADQVDLYDGSGVMYFVSHRGIIMGATGSPSQVGKSLVAALPGANELLVAVGSGEEYLQVKNGLLQVSAPFSLGSSNTPWAAVLVIPMSKISGQANAALLNMAVIGLVLTLLSLVLIWWASARVSKPLTVIAATARALAMGDLEQQVGIREEDEVGQLAQAFREMIDYMKAMSRAAQAIAAGDLTGEIEPRSGRDVLGQAFKDMQVGLRSAVSQVAVNAGELGQASGQLNATAVQAGHATANITSAFHEISASIGDQAGSVKRTASSAGELSRAIAGVASGAQEQASAVTNASQITARLSESIAQVAGNAAAVSEGSQKAAAAARQGSRTVQQTVTSMQAIKSKVSLSTTKVKEMGARSEQIGMIVETIEDIASQTNLLALNAAIEAARAGDHGKGFAVVADEVRKLSERAADATREIVNLIRTIQVSVTESVSAMLESAQEVENGVTRANESGMELNAILDAANSVSQQADQATNAAHQMSSLASNLVAAMDSVSSVVEQNTATTERMSASSAEVTSSIQKIAATSAKNTSAIENVSISAEEMAAQVKEVTASARELDELAQTLRSVVQRFKFDALGVTSETVDSMPVLGDPVPGVEHASV